MIRCIIVDDEELARRHAARLLEAHADCAVSGEGADGVEALELISHCEPDLMFLDIEMPGLNGFDVLAQLRHPPLIVFTTAYDEYAVRAFDANAMDYLLKPLQPSRLAQAIEKVRSRLTKPRKEYETSLRRAVSTFRTGPPAKLAAHRGKRIVLLSPREIFYAGIEDQTVFFYTQTERFATDRTIVELEEILAPAGFIRISRSAVVNLNHARELVPWSSGTWKLKLSNNAELDVSRDRGRHLKAKLC